MDNTYVRIERPWGRLDLTVDHGGDHTIYDVVNDLLRPGLLGIGFDQSLVNEVLND